MAYSFSVKTTKKQELIDITPDVKNIISESKVKHGICHVYLPHATAALTINENADPNIQEDILKVINKLVPEHDNYLHDQIDNNAAAHIKSTLIGVSVNIPISDNTLQLGTWQDIFLCEFQGPRDRHVLVEIIKKQ